jgi:hypothetical protein
MYRKPIPASKLSLKIAKRSHSDFDEISDISFLIEIFRRLNAHSTPFHTPNVAQTIFSVEIIPEIAKRNLSDFDEISVIPFLIEISQRLNGLSTPFYTPNVEQTSFSVDIRYTSRKSQNAIFQISTKSLLFRS